jgi:hypothetical protein
MPKRFLNLVASSWVRFLPWWNWKNVVEIMTRVYCFKFKVQGTALVVSGHADQFSKVVICWTKVCFYLMCSMNEVMGRYNSVQRTARHSSVLINPNSEIYHQTKDRSGSFICVYFGINSHVSNHLFYGGLFSKLIKLLFCFSLNMF